MKNKIHYNASYIIIMEFNYSLSWYYFIIQVSIKYTLINTSVRLKLKIYIKRQVRKDFQKYFSLTLWFISFFSIMMVLEWVNLVREKLSNKGFLNLKSVFHYKNKHSKTNHNYLFKINIRISFLSEWRVGSFVVVFKVLCLLWYLFILEIFCTLTLIRI